MSKRFMSINAKATAKASKKTLNDREHLVVPVVALVEGVFKGLYYPANSLDAFVEAWNGVPVPIRHPLKNGKFQTANAPHIENTQNIGKFYNVKLENKKLKGELWIDVEKTKKLGWASIITKLTAGEMMEVSTGMFLEVFKQGGTYNGQNYKLTAGNIHPDHLALLPDQIGACSIAGGCGAMRTNAAWSVDDCDCGCTLDDEDHEHACACGGEGPCQCEHEDDENEAETVEDKAMNEKIAELIAKIAEKVGLTSEEIGVNELGMQEIRDQARALIKKGSAEGTSYTWVEDVFKDYVIYEMSGGKLYKQNYSVDAADVVSLVGTAIEVIRKVTYVPAVAGNTTDEHPTEDLSMDREKLVAGLIANKATDFEAADKDNLLTLDEKVLKALETSAANAAEGGESDDKPEVKAEAKPEATPAANADAPADKPADTLTLSAEEYARVKTILAKEDESEAALRKQVANHYKELDEVTVNALSLEAVNGLAKAIKPKADYSGLAGSMPQVNTEANGRKLRQIVSAPVTASKE